MALTPTEDDEQRALAAWLDARGVAWFHPPNGGLRHPATARRLRAMGVKRGVPDCIIITPPPKRPGIKGVAVELKRIKGGRISPEQDAWLQCFEDSGWEVFVSKGAQGAIDRLAALGY